MIDQLGPPFPSRQSVGIDRVGSSENLKWLLPLNQIILDMRYRENVIIFQPRDNICCSSVWEFIHRYTFWVSVVISFPMKWPNGNGNYGLAQQLWEKPNAPQVSTCANKGLTSGSSTS